jgi:hypothetical protein
MSKYMYSRMIIFICFRAGQCNTLELTNSLIYEKTTMSSSTASQENDGNMHSNGTSWSFVSRQKQRQITEKVVSVKGSCRSFKH